MGDFSRYQVTKSDCHCPSHLVGFDVLDQGRLAAVVETYHEDAHVPTKTAHSRCDLLEQPHAVLRRAKVGRLGVRI